MTKDDWIRAVQRFVVNVGISGSSLRNQGASGVVDAARRFLAALDLTPLKRLNPADYPGWLNKTTDDLLLQFPAGARKWGAARKAVNILTAQAFLNGELTAAFDLARFGDEMETPLDSVAAKELRQMASGEKLPQWPGVGALKQNVSMAYQDVASEIARAKGVPRACLDVILWRPVLESVVRRPV